MFGSGVRTGMPGIIIRKVLKMTHKDRNRAPTVSIAAAVGPAAATIAVVRVMTTIRQATATTLLAFAHAGH